MGKKGAIINESKAEEREKNPSSSWIINIKFLRNAPQSYTAVP